MEFRNIKWIGHASFLVEIKGKKLYIDPFKLVSVVERADAILITHPHFDHLNMEDISKIADEDTEIYVTKDSVEKITVGNVTGVEPGREYSAGFFRFRTIPAYNVVEGRLDKHPKKNGWVGYAVYGDNTSIYHAGDTDFVEQMREVDVDLALIPMGGTYTMDVEEAIDAAQHIKAKAVAPMHYRAVLGHDKAITDEQRFSRGVSNSMILKEVQDPFVF